MFTNLVASEGRGRRAWNGKTVTASVVGHGLLLAGIVYASIIAPNVGEAENEPEEVTFIDIQDEPPPPPPPPVEAAPPPPDIPPPPQGFQDLIPPDVVPPDIPDIDLSQVAVSAEDFSGIGVRGGIAEGVVGGTPTNTQVRPVDPNEAYSISVLEELPRIINQAEVERILERLYPRMLRDAGIGDRVVVRFVIDAEGRVVPNTVTVVESALPQFATATIEATEGFRFSPGRIQGQAVQVLIEMPIVWTAR